MVYFDQILYTYSCQNCLTTGMCNNLKLMDEGLLSNQSSQLSHMIYQNQILPIYTFYHCQDTGMQNGFIARPAGVHCNHYVSLSVGGQLVKMLITIEPHGIF